MSTSKNLICLGSVSVFKTTSKHQSKAVEETRFFSVGFFFVSTFSMQFLCSRCFMTVYEFLHISLTDFFFNCFLVFPCRIIS
jgi:hypothetical protein